MLLNRISLPGLSLNPFLRHEVRESMKSILSLPRKEEGKKEENNFEVGLTAPTPG